LQIFSTVASQILILRTKRLEEQRRCRSVILE